LSGASAASAMSPYQGGFGNVQSLGRFLEEGSRAAEQASFMA
jgi:hypothetical protein